MVKKSVVKPIAKYYIYWETVANSGLWNYDSEIVAEMVAKDLTSKSHVSKVVLIDTEAKTETVFKNNSKR